GAACHPVFAAMSGSTIEALRVLRTEGFVFRNEPDNSPMRLRSFRQTESIFLGRGDEVQSRLSSGITALAELLVELGLNVTTEVASDPFTGRLARLRQELQADAATKLELQQRVSLDGSEQSLALASSNAHGIRFGTGFGILDSQGEPVSSGC